MPQPPSRLETLLQGHAAARIAGADEAGAGPLCGDLFAAAVILDPDQPLSGLDDSKRLSEQRREQIAEQIGRHAIAFAVARVTVEEIDRHNILHARMIGLARAVALLDPAPTLALIDGNRLPGQLCCQGEAVVQGDRLIPAIMAASILAKVTRDREMRQLDHHYPGYGLAQHKGYPTAAHLAALQRLGPTPIHRRSYAPVRRLLEASSESP